MSRGSLAYAHMCRRVCIAQDVRAQRPGAVVGDSCAIYHLALKYRQPRGRRLALGPHGQQVGVLGTLGVATDAAASIWHSSIRDSIASAAAAAALAYGVTTSWKWPAAPMTMLCT